MNADPNSAKAIFLEAVERHAPDEWPIYLDRACAGQPELRGRVEALLAAHREVGTAGHEDGEGVSPVATANEHPIREGPGSVIGPYKLLEQIGEGGFGVVFLAEQAQPIRRRVALKVLKPGMDTRQVVARFEAERQALALMDHPNIAQIHDGGTTPDGRPFFVMELVKGIPLTDYCNRCSLTTRERLELLLSVCHAVQHAHQKGVIHRDLKPSNVLVAIQDGKPAVKVIDFGIAKAVNQRLSEQTLATGFHQMVGTPLYMSPEQAQLSPLEVDTRADIYALGVLLYELLTGTTPLEKERLSNANYDELRRLIREEEPPTPSARLSTLQDRLTAVAAQRLSEPRQLLRTVRGELDWIVMKCLEKDRNRRYETANALAMDVQRYLADEPVQAGPPSALYRLRKFVRRNRGPTLSIGLVVLALVGGIAGTTAGLFRAENALRAEADQRRLAQDNERKTLAAAEAETAAKQTAQLREAETKAVLDFLVNRVIAAARPERKAGGLGRDVTLRQAIEKALAYVDKSFTKQPRIEARLRTTLGESFRLLGDYHRATEQDQRAYTLYAKHCGPDHADTLGSMSNLALSYTGLGRRAEAVKLYEETLARMRIRIPKHPFTYKCMHNLALSYASLGRHDEAVKLFEEALALEKANRGPDYLSILSTMSSLAHTYRDLGRHAEAVKLCEETLARQRATLGTKHPDTLITMGYLANCYTRVGRHDEAAKLHEESLALKKATLGPDHSSTLMGMHNLANSYSLAGRHAEALKLREETLAFRRGKLGPDHPDTLMSLVVVAATLEDLGRSAEAVPLIDDCLKRAAGKTIDPRIIPSAIAIRLRHFEKSNDAAGCRATAELWEQFRRTDAKSLYSAACLRAVTAAVQAKTPGAGAARLVDEDANRALAWLKQAVTAGYKDTAQMRKDKDLDALRGRDDFQKLLAESEKKREEPEKKPMSN